jgi:hypothetical protein
MTSAKKIGQFNLLFELLVTNRVLNLQDSISDVTAAHSQSLRVFAVKRRESGAYEAFWISSTADYADIQQKKERASQKAIWSFQAISQDDLDKLTRISQEYNTEFVRRRRMDEEKQKEIVANVTMGDLKGKNEPA